jgi:hypothetical protein
MVQRAELCIGFAGRFLLEKQVGGSSELQCPLSLQICF